MAQSIGVQVTPIMIQASPHTGLGSFRIHNGVDHERAFQLEAFAWAQDDGESVLTPTQDLVLAPSVFLAPAHGDQIVRLAAPRAALSATSETSYRVLLREVPRADETDARFRLVVEMSMPVFVTPRGARGMLAVTRVRGENGAPMVRLENNGTARLHLSNAPGAAGMDNLPRYLLAGQRLNRPAPPNANVLRLAVATAGDSAAQTREFDIDDGPLLADLH